MTDLTTGSKKGVQTVSIRIREILCCNFYYEVHTKTVVGIKSMQSDGFHSFEPFFIRAHLFCTHVHKHAHFPPRWILHTKGPSVRGMSPDQRSRLNLA